MHVIFRIKMQKMPSTNSLGSIGPALKIMILNLFLYDMIIVWLLYFIYDICHKRPPIKISLNRLPLPKINDPRFHPVPHLLKNLPTIANLTMQSISPLLHLNNKNPLPPRHNNRRSLPILLLPQVIIQKNRILHLLHLSPHRQPRLHLRGLQYQLINSRLLIRERLIHGNYKLSNHTTD